MANGSVKRRIDAPVITGAIQVRRSEDGNSATVEFVTEAEPVSVQIKTRDGGQLVAAGAHLLGQKIIPVGYHGEVQVIPVSNWSIVDGGEKTVLFSFELLHGPALAFSVAATAELMGALQAALGKPAPVTWKDGWAQDWRDIRLRVRSFQERWRRPGGVVTGPDSRRARSSDEPSK